MPHGPSTVTDPYLLPLEPNVSITSIITTGDELPDAKPGVQVFGGIPDGIGAFDNGDGTITVIVNHEIASGGLVRDHGGTGAYVDKLTINKATLAVTAADDLIQAVKVWDVATSSYVNATGTQLNFSRFCSGDLPAQTALLDSDTGLGTHSHIYFAGEEVGTNGRATATIVDGAGAGTIYELARLGNQGYENIACNPYEQAKTIVATTDDEASGELYIYVGTKQSTGTEVDKAGLTNGLLYGIAVNGVKDEGEANPLGVAGVTRGTFSLVAVDDGPGGAVAGDVSALNGTQIETFSESATNGITGFLRPEDFAWDAEDPRVAYFVTTDDIDKHSRLWKITLNDITNPQAGGTIEVMVDARDIGAQMFDNITVANGKVVIQEDPGNNNYVARVWEFDTASHDIHAIATFNPAQFADGGANFITHDEESSGVVDVTALLGDGDTRAYLLDAQVHKTTGDPATVEGGQLMVMYADDPTAAGTNGDDNLRGNSNVQNVSAGNGDDTVWAFGGNDNVSGGNGNDKLHAGTGNDTVDGGNGNDWLFGDLGNDTLMGGRGDDYFVIDNKGVSNGADQIIDFGGGDRLMTTVQLPTTGGIVNFGNDHDLDLFDGGSVTINDGAIDRLAFKGTVTLDGVTYYSYGLADGDKGVNGSFYNPHGGPNANSDVHLQFSHDLF